jgi:hypothetical protein
MVSVPIEQFAVRPPGIPYLAGSPKVQLNKQESIYKIQHHSIITTKEYSKKNHTLKIPLEAVQTRILSPRARIKPHQ